MPGEAKTPLTFSIHSWADNRRFGIGHLPDKRAIRSSVRWRIDTSLLREILPSLAFCRLLKERQCVSKNRFLERLKFFDENFVALDVVHDFPGSLIRRFRPVAVFVIDGFQVISPV